MSSLVSSEVVMPDLAAVLNALPVPELETTLRRCCGATRWVARMRAQAPFGREARVRELAREIWWSLDAEDWLEAFAAHPRIGDRQSAEGWARDEQAGVEAADASLLVALERGNAEYERRFGFVFLVCASGLTAAEMLETLEQRLANTPETELKIAATEQAAITRLRLLRLADEA